MLELERKTSTLRRGIKFATIVLTGTLFDTHFFNRCIDIMEQNDLDFRIIEWEVGNTSLDSSSVTLQIVAQSCEAMDKAKDLLEEERKKHKVEIYEGSGPDYEENLPKLIHQDRVR